MLRVSEQQIALYVPVLLSIGAGGAFHSLIQLGPVITFALPIIAMIRGSATRITERIIDRTGL
ncbi:hypothetical protein Pth03_74770 [Planotetraspora thailandica]|uniref:Uncharacterized protein n=1 Tax=Planotetraspora thailandica TaxID=487172 RepID=A0A8J3Y1E1_9ACTN|nr:hypothetical protein [Planotetraspora thailandica]GII59088.1 hypothetical protein Pth03_74770 [Planotetraspora thailandica]